MAYLRTSKKSPGFKLTSRIKQATPAQDFAAHGTTLKKKMQFMSVCDGHGSSNTIDHLRQVKWPILLDDDDFVSTLINDINKIQSARAPYKIRGDGSTLSVVRINNNKYIECYWVGDSSIKVFENGEEIFKSKDHNYNNKEDIHRISETCNMRGIHYDNIWDIKVIDPTLIKSIPSAIFDFGDNDKISITHSLGHEGKTGSHYGYEKILIDPIKTYKIVVASDGFWDMTCESDHGIISDVLTDATNLVQFADSRWRQKWTHDNTIKHVTNVSFPDSNIDDIAVAVGLFTPLIL